MSDILKCDVAVVGAGHAGAEAAAASSRLGLDTVLFTLSLDSVANMPCNPSVGGTGKGHLVYEIDALGGIMGRAADLAAVSSRTLNESKGAAVRSKRVQADRRKYKAVVTDMLKKEPNLRLVQAEIVRLEVTAGRITAVITRMGERWECSAAVLCCGTYLCGMVHVGDIHYPAGPDGSLSADRLTESLRSEGLSVMRFKTGTPVRASARTIDFSRLEEQVGEAFAVPFSHLTPDDYLDGQQRATPCHIVYTNAKTHEIIKKNLHRSAMYSGNIHGVGPRYCPSIEDKIVRFADKERHQLFIEPMGEDDDEVYIQGFSTSMPTEVQREMLHSLEGFENAHITRNAYAIEYDLCNPTELDVTLGFKKIRGLYGAGQFNGTSGYEEAAAQGLVAGANAALYVKNESPLIIERQSSYIGIMIDDLINKGVTEPYRIMTSRSEYRLLMRQDNADLRLTPKAHGAGLIDEESWESFLARRRRVDSEISRLGVTVISVGSANEMLERCSSSPVRTACRAAELLRRPEVSYEAICEASPPDEELSRKEKLTVSAEIKYEGYIKKQEAAVKSAQRAEGMKLPADIDYREVSGLRREAEIKLSEARPESVGQASRISGVNPADITALLIYLEAKRRERHQ
ncbi:MAG: tRNA uridine-5-carboxymethylaminomethyl(34) synthesis enzyme MnmG [Firmicutes bacterium]|nr:tRNA uridine-5-carboxymethylaminomethyl(34) synthesis enzyme MnmG [Bacillota bacterium]